MNQEARYWRERYEMMAASISDIVGRFANPPTVLIAEKESYEAGRILGANEEREACARVADKYAGGPERNYSENIADEIRARVNA
jgi:hypothetical protein